MRPFPEYREIPACTAFVIAVSAGSAITTDGTQHVATPGRADTIRYSLALIIHGSGDVLYHNAYGEPDDAANEALNAAIKAALPKPRAAVYIFRRQFARFALFRITLQDGVFRYARDGKWTARLTDWRDDGISRFGARARLCRERHAPKASERVSFFLYFVRETSELERVGYDASYTKRVRNGRSMSERRRDFTSDTTKFDLLVLSPRFGGAQRTAAPLSTCARTIAASPEYLSLAYHDFRLFEKLLIYVRSHEFSHLSNHDSRQVFNRLINEVLTTATVAEYDNERRRSYVRGADSIYHRKLSELKDHAPGSVEYVDWHAGQVSVLSGMSDGADLPFRSARFFRSKKQDQSPQPTMPPSGASAPGPERPPTLSVWTALLRLHFRYDAPQSPYRGFAHYGCHSKGAEETGTIVRRTARTDAHVDVQSVGTRIGKNARCHTPSFPTLASHKSYIVRSDASQRTLPASQSARALFRKS
jgi:hypothetical protein